MWIDFSIEEQKYFINCEFQNKDTGTEVLGIVYNGTESWHERKSLEEILRRVKELNKRIKYEENTIRETLQTSPAELATFVEKSEGDEKIVLKLKYRVKEFPFNFEWTLNKQNLLEFQETIFLPLFKILHGVTQQNKELREIVRKKDVELKQFKLEGTELKRSTLATKPFNAFEFDRKYADSTELTQSYIKIADYLKDKCAAASTSETATEKPQTSKEAAIKKEANTNSTYQPREEVKLSPRKKRRKAIEEKHRILAEKMKASHKGLQYDSQSQSLSQSSSNGKDSDEETTAKETDSGDDVLSQDVKDILSELKTLEEKRLADLKNRSMKRQRSRD